MSQTPPTHLSVLVLEDEMLVAMLLEDMLMELGYRVVGPFSTVAAALAAVTEERVDLALLDVNLSGGQSGYPVADHLTVAGVPFGFVTGYGAAGLKAEFKTRPTLHKPFRAAELAEVVNRVRAE